MSTFPKKDVVAIAVTGAAGQVCYSLLPMIAQGLMMGEGQKVELKLLDIEPMQKALEGVRMELLDSSFPLLVGVSIFSDARAAFEGVDICLLCGAFPRKPGTERKDMLLTNAKIFSSQGAVLREVAPAHCRILVVGNPANTNALILYRATKGAIDPKNITAMTRLDHNRSLGQISAIAKVPISNVKNVIIWGNHSSTQVPDVNNAKVGETPVREYCKADAFFDGEFIQTVQQRGAQVLKLRGLSSAFSAAKACVDHMRSWIHGTPPGTFVSMAVVSNGNPFGIPDELVYSFPVVCSNGQWSFVPDVTVSPRVRELMDLSMRELQEERTMAGL